MDKVNKIQLTKGKMAIVDADKYDYLNQWKWQYGNVGYAYRGLNKKKKIYMHQTINETPKDSITDHINGDKLDNRRSNLRTVNSVDNGRNRDKNTNNTSGYKGVAWDKSKNKWLASIRVNYKHIFLGRFNKIENAIQARKKGEELLWI